MQIHSFFLLVGFTMSSAQFAGNAPFTGRYYVPSRAVIVPGISPFAAPAAPRASVAAVPTAPVVAVSNAPAAVPQSPTIVFSAAAPASAAPVANVPVTTPRQHPVAVPAPAAPARTYPDAAALRSLMSLAMFGTAPAPARAVPAAVPAYHGYSPVAAQTYAQYSPPAMYAPSPFAYPTQFVSPYHYAFQAPLFAPQFHAPYFG